MKKEILLYLFFIAVFASCKKNDVILEKSLTNEIMSAKNGGGSNVNLNQGLVAYYPFNGNANDVSGYKNNGTVFGAFLVNDRNKKKNSAYSFDGISNYIAIPNSDSYTNNEMTISYWKKTGLWRQDTDLIYGNSSEFSWQTGWNNNNNIGMQIMCYGGNGGSSSTALLDTNWNNLTFVIKGSQLSLYINGILNNSLNNNTAISCNNSTYKLYIGNDFYSNPEYYQFIIDDLRIYNRAINESEILYLAKN
jgi:hypothetical protein